MLLRGHLLLPDIFINARVTRPDETGDLRANAYASLKELNGIIRSIRGTGHTRNTIDLEFMPGQRNLAVDRVPYDSVFLSDYENADNKSLGTGEEAINRYLEQAADALFLQLFTPIGEKNISHEDNLIRKVVEADGLNLYASSGVAKLIYPYEDLLEYCACHAVKANLEGQWLQIDALYRREMKNYNRAIQGGDMREKPRLSRLFTTRMEELGGTGSHHPFFTPLFRSTQHLDKQNRPTGSKAATFVRAIREHLQSILGKNRIFQGHLLELKDYPREKELKNRKQVKAEVQQTEDKIYAFRQFVLYELVPQSSTPLIYTILQEDADAESCLAGVDEYRLNTWLLKKPEAMHPLAIRYFLYDLEHLLDKEIQALDERVRDQERIITNYEKAFDVIETEDIQEDAVMRVEMALKQGPLQLLIGKNELKKFADIYLSKSRQMKNALISYTTDKVLYDVFTVLQAAIREFSRRWQHFFDNLISEQRDLDARISFLEQQHAAADDPTNRYVLADPEDKRFLWQDVQESHGDDQASLTPLWDQLYCNMYKTFTRGHLNQYLDQDSREPSFSLTENLLRWHREQLADHSLIKVPLVKILRRKNIDPVALLQDVARRAIPWLNKPLGGGREMQYWGINPVNFDLLSADERERAFAEVHCISRDNFSPYEMICYTSMYGLTAEDLAKFQSRGLQGDQGNYFLAYQEKRKALLADEHRNVTHHLDKRWHLDAYLPDLNKEFAKANQEAKTKSFLYGLIYRYLRCYENDGQRIWHFYGETVQDVKVHTHLVEEGYYMIFDALSYNPAIVDSIQEYADKQRKADLKAFGENIREHGFIKGCFIDDERTIFDAVLMFGKEQPGRDLHEEMIEVIQGCVDLICQYIAYCHGPHKKHQAFKTTREIVADLQKKSSVLQDMDKGPRQKWVHIIDRRLEHCAQ